jgi:flagellar protein FliS
MRKQYLDAYRSTLETDVANASPHRLILMLFDGALQAIRQARIHMERNSIAEKGALISKAISIVEEGLHAALDHEVGGELSANLGALYDYCARRLFEANLKNDTQMLDEVAQLLAGLREAWASIGTVEAIQASPPDEGKPRQGLSYGSV